ncbi:aminotransferase [Hortaea werneckii]|nr:aminotransferase [Hortaea werneckii]
MITTEVLDPGELRIRDHFARRVPGITGQDDRSAATDLLRDLVRVDMVLVLAVERNGHRSKVPKQAEHLVVGSVVRDEEAEIGVAQHGGDADEPCAAAGDDAHVLPGILAFFALAVVGVVELGDLLAQGLDAGCRAVFAPGHRYIDRVGSFEAAFDVCEDISITLAKVRPSLGIFEEAVFVCAFGRPDYACRSSRWVETGMRLVAMMSCSEITVWFRFLFYRALSEVSMAGASRGCLMIFVFLLTIFSVIESDVLTIHARTSRTEDCFTGFPSSSELTRQSVPLQIGLRYGISAYDGRDLFYPLCACHVMVHRVCNFAEIKRQRRTKRLVVFFVTVPYFLMTYIHIRIEALVHSDSCCCQVHTYRASSFRVSFPSPREDLLRVAAPDDGKDEASEGTKKLVRHKRNFSTPRHWGHKMHSLPPTSLKPPWSLFPRSVKSYGFSLRHLMVDFSYSEPRKLRKDINYFLEFLHHKAPLVGDNGIRNAATQCFVGRRADEAHLLDHSCLSKLPAHPSNAPLSHHASCERPSILHIHSRVLERAYEAFDLPLNGLVRHCNTLEISRDSDCGRLIR